MEMKKFNLVMWGVNRLKQDFQDLEDLQDERDSGD